LNSQVSRSNPCFPLLLCYSSWKLWPYQSAFRCFRFSPIRTCARVVNPCLWRPTHHLLWTRYTYMLWLFAFNGLSCAGWTRRPLLGLRECTVIAALLTILLTGCMPFASAG
jgi:hypothetical protein